MQIWREMASNGSHYRVLLIATGLLFLLLWARLFDLQVIDYQHYRRTADENRIQMAVDIASRGLIRDRNDTILAMNEPSYSIYLLRPKAVPLQEVVEHLASILDQDSSLIMDKLRTSSLPYYEPVRISRHIPLATVCKIEEQNEMLPGIILRYETTRRYPDPANGSHVLGYLNEASDEAIADGASPGSFVGVRGIEQEYDTYLRGIDGATYLDVTAAGQVVGVSRDQPPNPSVPGAGTRLTLDWDLQKFCADALAKRGSGAVVCMDPRNGEVLAMVNSPSFDANVFSGILKPEVWNELVTDSSHPLLDRAARGLYPPGSTTKLITAAAALETGIAAPSTKLAPCFGGMQFGNRYFRCWHAAGHGSLDMIGAIEQSCDVYFYLLGQRLGVDRWAKYARESGFGKKTGIDLPNEAAGLVPDSAYYNRRYGKRGWTWTLVLNLAIGQGEFLTTPLQLAEFYCAIANNGQAYRPHILQALTLSEGHEVLQPVRESYRLPYSQRTLDVLHRGLRRVVAGQHGTARGLNYPDLTVAGKTGTAQNPHGDNHAWFACYAPYEDPQVVVVALVENAGHGGEIAAPLCGEILRHYFKLPSLTHPKVDSTETAPPPPKVASEEANSAEAINR